MNYYLCFFRGLLSLLIVSLLFSCRKESSIDQVSVSTPAIVETRTAYDNTVLGKATQFDISEELVSKYVVESDESARIRSIEPYVYMGDVSFYVVDLEEGWMIISSDARTKAVLAKGESGSFNLSARNNSNIQFWLQDMADQIHAVKQSNIEVIDRSWGKLDLFKHHSRIPIDTLSRSVPNNADSVWIVMLHRSDTTESVLDVPHLLETKWGQMDPWNMLLDPFYSGFFAYLTGAIPTAIAQVLYYFHDKLGRPSGLYHSINLLSMNPYYEQEPGPEFGFILVEKGKTTSVARSDYQSISSRWDSMPLNYTAGISNTIGAGYVSELMIDIGNRLLAIYKDNETTIPTYPFSSYVDLSKCNIEYDWGLYNYSIRDSIFLNLSDCRPVIVTATSAANDHAWVIDGYYHKETTVRNTYTYHYISYSDFQNGIIPSLGVLVDWFISLQELRRFYPNAPKGFDKVTETHHNRYFRMNWGCNGNLDDGVYSCNALESWGAFSMNRAVYYNLMPSINFEYAP